MPASSRSKVIPRILMTVHASSREELHDAMRKAHLKRAPLEQMNTLTMRGCPYALVSEGRAAKKSVRVDLLGTSAETFLS